MAVAGEIWTTEFRFMQYPEGDAGCVADRRFVARHLDDVGAREAAKRARLILREHRGEVLELAQRLDREGCVDL